MLKTDPGKAAASIQFALRLVQLSARLAWSIIPELSETVLRLLGENERIPAWPWQTENFLLTLASPLRVSPLDVPLVRKLGPSDVTRLETRFKGRDEFLPSGHSTDGQ